MTHRACFLFGSCSGYIYIARRVCLYYLTVVPPSPSLRQVGRATPTDGQLEAKGTHDGSGSDTSDNRALTIVTDQAVRSTGGQPGTHGSTLCAKHTHRYRTAIDEKGALELQGTYTSNVK